MRELVTLIVFSCILGIIGLAMHNDGRDTILDLIHDHQEASSLIQQLGQGNDEALYELEDHAQRGGLPYALFLASYNATLGDYKSRDKAILGLLKKANSLESLFILQEVAYLYDNQALATVLSEMMDEDGRIPPHVYISVEKTLFSQEQLNLLSQCYQRLGVSYGKPAQLNWNHFVQHGWENIIGREGVCFSFDRKRTTDALAVLD